MFQKNKTQETTENALARRHQRWPPRCPFRLESLRASNPGVALHPKLTMSQKKYKPLFSGAENEFFGTVAPVGASFYEESKIIRIFEFFNIGGVREIRALLRTPSPHDIHSSLEEESPGRSIPQGRPPSSGRRSIPPPSSRDAQCVSDRPAVRAPDDPPVEYQIVPQRLPVRIPGPPVPLGGCAPAGPERSDAAAGYETPGRRRSPGQGPPPDLGAV
ncbi:hypothetical protein AAG570_005794 [Ranatra chinensis]|uniref:Uncharacterized protein n=1 Tax=Ranatra chinensis TaxID=642074 RepID=A0ABD0YGU8_9HEMI